MVPGLHCSIPAACGPVGTSSSPCVALVQSICNHRRRALSAHTSSLPLLLSGLGAESHQWAPCRPCSGQGALRKGQRLVIQHAQNSPPDAPKGPSGGREWLQTLLSRFGPMTERAQNTTVLDFEKPLVELDNRIKEVRCPLRKVLHPGLLFPWLIN